MLLDLNEIRYRLQELHSKRYQNTNLNYLLTSYSIPRIVTGQICTFLQGPNSANLFYHGFQSSVVTWQLIENSTQLFKHRLGIGGLFMETVMLRKKKKIKSSN